MVGTLTIGSYRYAFANALVQTSPNEPPKPSKILLVVDESGVEVQVTFLGREQWEEFQRQVAEEKPPSEIIVAKGVPGLNGDGRLN